MEFYIVIQYIYIFLEFKDNDKSVRKIIPRVSCGHVAPIVNQSILRHSLNFVREMLQSSLVTEGKHRNRNRCISIPLYRHSSYKRFNKNIAQDNSNVKVLLSTRLFGIWNRIFFEFSIFFLYRYLILFSRNISRLMEYYRYLYLKYCDKYLLKKRKKRI